MFATGGYQMGFKKGHSTMENLALLLNQIMRTLKKRSERKIYCAIDLRKAYDRLDRQKLFAILQARAKTDEEFHLVNLMINLYKDQKMRVG